MQGLLTVFAKEFLDNLRDRRTLISALLFGPLFGPILFGAMVSRMLDQNSFEGKMHDLLSRQARLEQHGSILAALATQAGGRDPALTADGRPRAAKGVGEYPAVPDDDHPVAQRGNFLHDMR